MEFQYPELRVELPRSAHDAISACEYFTVRHISVSFSSDRSRTSLLSWVDLLFCALVVLFAVLAVRGSYEISGGGAIIDSDLATYAEGMAGAAHPTLFANDPMLHERTAANSIPNLERWLANFMTRGDDFAGGLISSSGFVLVLFFLSWYIFGRWLFQRRDFALLLTACVSITVWVGLGTFWGITHSDPVPRVFHAALFPFMLMLCIEAYELPFLRPLAMLVAGLGMWLHGVSALNCGAMFFVAFFFHRPDELSLSGHLFIVLLSLAAFFLPVLIYLWPSLHQAQPFSADDLRVFNELFTLRWKEDYGNIPASLIHFVSPLNPVAYLLYAGLIGSIISRFLPNSRLRNLARMIPFFVLALALVVAFSLLETRFAQDLGRVPMGHELVRGVKFLVPLSWIVLLAPICFLLARLPKVLPALLAIATFIAVVFFSHDKQYLAAAYAVSDVTGIRLPLVTEAEKARSRALAARAALDAIREVVPEGVPVFCLEDSMMAIRYLAFRPLIYSFKDGYAYFYSKDVEGSRTWLKYTRQVQTGDEGVKKALKESMARWYLAPKNAVPVPSMRKVWGNSSWTLFSAG